MKSYSSEVKTMLTKKDCKNRTAKTSRKKCSSDNLDAQCMLKLNTYILTLETSLEQIKGYSAVLAANFQILEQSPLLPLSTTRTKIAQHSVTLSLILEICHEALKKGET